MVDKGQMQKETMVRFERVLPGPIERAWEFLTQAEHLPAWLGEGTIEPRVGGSVNIGDGHIRGVVTQWTPPHRLAFTWNVFMPGDTQSPYPQSYVTFELEAKGEDVLLTLTHLPILEGFEAQTMMGWHTILDLLVALLRGETPELREAVMERNRVRYGVTEIKR